jgi:hypothetical protein
MTQTGVGTARVLAPREIFIVFLLLPWVCFYHYSLKTKGMSDFSARTSEKLSCRRLQGLLPLKYKRRAGFSPG